MTERRLTYAESGVDILAADRLVAQISALARASHGEEVQPGPDAFAGLFRLPAGETLAATCDGVGTKLLVAKEAGRYEGIGQDLVAMNVNDLAVVGARPLFFLDYIAVGRLDPGHVLEIVRGAAEACAAIGCALLGGETAEMPGLYRPGDMDIAGFAVGLVEAERRPDPGGARPGDIVLGLASTGIHANGTSLARAALAKAGISLDRFHPDLASSIAEALLEPTALYTPTLDHSMPGLHALAHVTGGGLAGRAAALANEGLTVHIDASGFSAPPIFSVIQQAGDVTDTEMAATFNMGLGFLAAVSSENAGAWLEGDHGWIEAGEIRAGDHGVEIHR